MNAVRASAQQLISQWLLTLTIGRPNVTKTFQVIVPAQIKTIVHKVNSLIMIIPEITSLIRILNFDN